MSVDISFFTDPPPVDPEPEAKPRSKPRKVEIQTLVWSKKREKEWDRSFKLAQKAIDGAFRLPKAAPMTPAERREKRRLDQIARRSEKAVEIALLRLPASWLGQ